MGLAEDSQGLGVDTNDNVTYIRGVLSERCPYSVA